ncbi:MAG: 1,4-alpha-glucan branching protein GlgB [Gammaproteobacteria bacterium]|nr:1,4-alpha-glucan branching protein GlgB [Gammaproteobacteria bacterium]
MVTRTQYKLPDNLRRIIDARHHDPFSVLGRHPVTADQELIRTFQPHVRSMHVGEKRLEMSRIEGTDIFEWQGATGQVEKIYQFYWVDSSGQEHQCYDPYCFDRQISDFDLHLFNEGKHWHVYRCMGANFHCVNEVAGILFSTWAPNAERVSIIGDFNDWDGRCHPMRNLGASGVWELFIPGLGEKTLYKLEIRNRETGSVMAKIDPYGRQFELRPRTAAVIPVKSTHVWQDQSWMAQRNQYDWLHKPVSIYEVHLGSWQRDEKGGFLDYRVLAERLVHYVKQHGFTHIELLPVTEHPLDASWGYQTTGYFAPSSRFGTPDAFRFFVDHCHQNGIGVFLDWVPAHFPKDEHGLARFDGSPLYEHEDPRKGEHRDWGTLIYNYGRNEVKNFLLSSVVYWLEELHIDGLRVDAVASMLYLDYSREANDWVPNKYGGNENLEAIEFIKELNTVVHGEFPGVLVMAEESTAWPQVTRPVDLGGLGFSMKWNMGWMHDTLKYMSKDPVHRCHHHEQLTFGLLYSFTENFILPFSHDEVVHGKSSMLNKMPGDEWQRFANLRLLYTYMFSYPGKKLLFMGCEFGQGTEWNHDASLDWYVLDYPLHEGLQRLVKDLNNIYRTEAALHQYDFESQGFDWIDCNDAAHSIIIFQRKSDHERIIVVCNFTPVPHHGYRIGVPFPGTYREILNSDSSHYGGSNMGNGEHINTENTEWMGHPCSLSMTLPPLSVVILKHIN